MISGINHLTFSVRNLEESVSFYTEVLGFQLVARWDRGAHLLAGEAWITLILDSSTRDGALTEYTHAAFSVAADDLAALDRRIQNSGAGIWQENQTEGESLYFLDPNGHKLEIHASDLKSRIEADKENPPQGMEFHN